MSLSVRAGEHWALLGADGAGKTTLLGLLGALTHPTHGTVEVLGSRLGTVDLRELRSYVGHVNPRHPLRSPLRVHDVVLTGLTNSVERPPRRQPTPEQERRADRLIRTLGLAGRREARRPTLSQGERGRALIARALMPDPRHHARASPAGGPRTRPGTGRGRPDRRSGRQVLRPAADPGAAGRTLERTRPKAGMTKGRPPDGRRAPLCPGHLVRARVTCSGGPRTRRTRGPCPR
ncbi:hypothetical protein GCM10010317_081030 [Streptomyces mirabilis]|nr:hypothetical protein GCM10010317_081030 [Streptomyces mirabilis]